MAAEHTCRRTPQYNLTRNVFQLFIAVLIGTTFLQLGFTQQDLSCMCLNAATCGSRRADRVASVFFTM